MWFQPSWDSLHSTIHLYNCASEEKPPFFWLNVLPFISLNHISLSYYLSGRLRLRASLSITWDSALSDSTPEHLLVKEQPAEVSMGILEGLQSLDCSFPPPQMW